MYFKHLEKYENIVLLSLSAYLVLKICLNQSDVETYHFINYKFTKFNEYKIEQSLLFVSVFWSLIFDFVTVFYVLRPNRRNNNKLADLRKESVNLQKMKGNEMSEPQFNRMKLLRELIPQTVRRNKREYDCILRDYVDSVGSYSFIFVLFNFFIYLAAKLSDHFYLARILVPLVNFYGFVRTCRFHEKSIKKNAQWRR